MHRSQATRRLSACVAGLLGASLLILPAAPAAADGPTTCTVGDFEYEVDPADVPAGAELIRGGSTASIPVGAVTIPDEITCADTVYPVTEIGYGAFLYLGVKSLTLGSNIRRIGALSFASAQFLGGELPTEEYLNRVGDVTIPDSVTEIGYGAFLNGGVTGLTLGDSVQTIGHLAFGDTAAIPNVYTTIGDLTLPDSLTSLGEKAFYGSGVTGLTIGSGLSTIGDEAFAGSEFSDDLTMNLGRLVIPETVDRIDGGAFASAGITNLDLGHSIRVIGDAAFLRNDLGQLTIPDSVTYIGDAAFGSSGVTDLHLGSSVEIIEMRAFGGNDLGDVAIPDSVTTIKTLAFYDAHVTNVTFGTDLTTLEQSVFRKNPGLASATFAGPAPTTFTAAQRSDFGFGIGSLGAADGLIVRYLQAFDDANTAPTPGFTTPTWQGYTTQVIPDGPQPTETTVTVQPPAGSVTYGDTPTVTGAVGTGNPDDIPAGDAQFTVDGDEVGSPVSVGADGSFTSPPLTDGAGDPLSAGSHSVVATFTPDDAGYSASASEPLDLSVDQADQSITFTSTAPADVVVDDSGYEPSATATSGLPVEFTVTGDCAYDGAVVSFPTPGTCVVHADQPGNDDYAPAASVTQVIEVAGIAPEFAGRDHRTFRVGRSNRTWTPTVLSGNPAPTVSVTGGSLPDGLSLDADTGVISGEPHRGSGGRYEVELTASNGVSPDTVITITLTVKERARISGSHRVTFSTGEFGSFTPDLIGYPAPQVRIARGRLPWGMSLDPDTGAISGSPSIFTVGWNRAVTLQASNGIGRPARHRVRIKVVFDGCTGWWWFDRYSATCRR